MDFVLRRLDWKVKPSPMALVVEVLHGDRGSGKRRLFSSHMASQSTALCVWGGGGGGEGGWRAPVFFLFSALDHGFIS